MRHKRRRLRRKVEHKDLALVQIPTQHVPAVWPLCHAFIAASCEDNEWSVSELYREAMLGRMALWFAANDDTTDGALITQFIDTPQGKVCSFVACGGKNMEQWLGLLDEVETWAKKEGCSIVRIIGRKGWARRLHDYTLTRVVLDKRL